jgi:uncharacterized protein YecE (DUF72 family)
VPPVVAATTSLAVLRMHGHNAETWTKRVETAAERFDYLYSADELSAWVPRIERLAEDAREVHVLMNNCHRDYSVRNAHEIGDLLGVSGQWPVTSAKSAPSTVDIGQRQDDKEGQDRLL